MDKTGTENATNGGLMQLNARYVDTRDECCKEMMPPGILHQRENNGRKS